MQALPLTQPWAALVAEGYFPVVPLLFPDALEVGEALVVTPGMGQQFLELEQRGLAFVFVSEVRPVLNSDKEIWPMSWCASPPGSQLSVAVLQRARRIAPLHVSVIRSGHKFIATYRSGTEIRWRR